MSSPSRRFLMVLFACVLIISACDGAPGSSSSSTSSNASSRPSNQSPAAPAPPTAPVAAAPTAAPDTVERTPLSPKDAQSQSPQPEFNHFTQTAEDPESTFALDVDTASFSVAQAYLADGRLPPADLIRVEEFVNRFDYRYPAPTDTFGITVDGARSPFGTSDAQLVRIGIQGRALDGAERTPAVITLVIDVSGSMDDPNRLPLVKQSLNILLEQLGPDDTVALVTYGDTAEIVMQPTGSTGWARLVSAIDQLRPNGSTNAEAGLALGYEVADRAFDPDKINRVILASDGVANVGASGPAAILRTISDRAQQGIFLTTVGFGMGEYNDYLMEQLANDGNGHYAYVNTLAEAEQLFRAQLTGTLQVIAQDARVQVEFNPEVVSAYRLLGYENRAMADADFRNDAADAGEVGAGHSVTALYEVIMREQRGGDMLQVKLRWADLEDGEVREIGRPFNSEELQDDFRDAAPSFRLAVAAATFAEILRGNAYTGELSLGDVSRVVRELRDTWSQEAYIYQLSSMIEQASALQEAE